MKLNLILFLLSVVLAFPCLGSLFAEEMDITSQKAIPKMFPGFTSSTVAFIQLSKRKPQTEIDTNNLQGNDQYDFLVLQKGPEGWAIGGNHEKAGLKVRESAVYRNLLDQIAEIRVDQKTLISQQADDVFLKSRDLTPESGIGIQCKNEEGRDVAVLIRGRSTKADRAGALDGYFVSRPDRPKEVVLYEPPSKQWHVSMRDTDWLDMTIHEFAEKNVKAFYFQNEFGSAGFQLKEGSDATFLPIREQCSKNIKKIDAPRQGEIFNMIRAFQRVQAEDYGRTKVESDRSGTLHVRAAMKTGEVYEVWVKPKERPDGNFYMCASSERNFLFRWPEFSVGKFLIDPQTLFDR